MDPITQISVEQIGAGRWRVAWDADCLTEPVRIRAARSPDAMGDLSPLKAVGGWVEVDLPTDWFRPFFCLEPTAGSPMWVAERQVPLAGGVNFRDLGGYRTDDGRRVRWGKLFRSGHLSKLTAGDQERLDALEIRTVCDFRMAEERATENATIACAPVLETLGIPPGLKDRFFFHRLFEQTDDPAVVVDAMHELMRSLIGESAPHYARLFAVLQQAAAGSVLLNCSAGKERTGVGAALLLLALGVPRETILYDFTLSRRYFPAQTELPRALEKYAVKARPGRDVVALMEPLLVTRESYLEVVLAEIDQHYASDADFLQQALGLTPAARAALRDRYTA